jgi:shikimate dehydrogenase
VLRLVAIYDKREHASMKRLAVLGYPVAHSRSPAMQNAALSELGLGDEWSYEAIEVAPDELEPRVRAMPDEGFVGANVTVPHKSAALALADSLSETAREIGAANTLCFADREIRADNTDAQGLLDALSEPRGGKRALVLGAGGAARAIVWALLREGAEVEVWNRTGLRSQHLCEELGGRPVAEPDMADYGIVVNSTAVGLHGEDPFAELPLAADGFAPEQIVVDMVYGAEPTALLRAADAAGARTVDGLEVLVRQGAHSLRIWTGREAPLDTMRRAAREPANF